jgi:hypothetical protein
MVLGDRANSVEGRLASVIIPNHNHAGYVGEAIGSVLAQEYRNIEVIVVDDGSTDDSLAVIRRFADRVRVVEQSQHGLSAARNRGIREARGSYVCFLDADDLYEPSFLSFMIPFLEGDAEADGAYCAYRFVDSRNTPLPERSGRVVPPAQVHQALLRGNFLVPEAVLLRRSCLAEGDLFDESLRACEDWDLWLRLSRRRRLIGAQRLLTRHRVLPGSMSADPELMLHSRKAVLDKYFAQETRAGMQERESAYGRAHLRATVEFLQQGAEEQAHLSFRRMAEISPPLLEEIETYYELGCGDQAKGFRGCWEGLDVERSAARVLEFLHMLFDGADRSERRPQACAHAYFALGLLAYGNGEFRRATSFFVRGALISPEIVLQGSFLPMLSKSVLRTPFARRRPRS